MIKKVFLILLLFFIFNVFTNVANMTTGSIKDDPKEQNQGGVVTLPNPLDPNKTDDPKDDPSPQALIGKIINAALGIVGSLALVMFIYGGFMWMMAGGNAERVQKGKDTLVWAALGLVIIFSSYALVRFVLKAIGAE